MSRRTYLIKPEMYSLDGSMTDPSARLTFWMSYTRRVEAIVIQDDAYASLRPAQMRRPN